MSEQPPLASPSGPDPAFEQYAAPAWGQASPEPGAGQPQGGPAPYPGGPPAGQQPYQVPPQYMSHPGATTHPLAVTSLVLGISSIVGIVLTPFLGITLLAGVCSPFAIWLGVRSRREIRADPRRYGGEGIATGGLVTGIVGLVLGVIALLVVAAFVIFLVAIFDGVA